MKWRCCSIWLWFWRQSSPQVSTSHFNVACKFAKKKKERKKKLSKYPWTFTPRAQLELGIIFSQEKPFFLSYVLAFLDILPYIWCTFYQRNHTPIFCFTLACFWISWGPFGTFFRAWSKFVFNWLAVFVPNSCLSRFQTFFCVQFFFESSDLVLEV